MKLINKLLPVFLLAFIAQPSFAGDGSGKVQIEHVGQWNGKDLVFLYTSSRVNEPACNSYQKRWVLDISSGLGKAQYSLLLSAQTTGKEVEVAGTSSCDLYEGSETVHWVGYPVDSADLP